MKWHARAARLCHNTPLEGGGVGDAHQAEGDNTNSDWWGWETRPGSTVAEPSGDAIDHVHRYPEDIALLASLGLGVYRFGVEWFRIEPEEGTFDQRWLDHYRSMVETVRSHSMVPMVTLNHFTLPRWVADRGGWLSPDIPCLFERYCRTVAAHLGDGVDRYTTINEPGVVAFGGYLGVLGFPPGLRSVDAWYRSIENLRNAHRLARAAVKEARPEAKVGATHSMAEWEANAAGRPMVEHMRRQMEDVFLDVCGDDDYIGVQTYTRIRIDLPRALAPGAWLMARSGWLRRLALPRVLGAQMAHADPVAAGNSTDMGYEYRPQAIADGIPLRGYVHWSAFDNFEWALGYRMHFGLIEVDRATQERLVKPSARFLGELARTGTFEV